MLLVVVGAVPDALGRDMGCYIIIVVVVVVHSVVVEANAIAGMFQAMKCLLSSFDGIPDITDPWEAGEPCQLEGRVSASTGRTTPSEVVKVRVCGVWTMHSN